MQRLFKIINISLFFFILISIIIKAVIHPQHTPLFGYIQTSPVSRIPTNGKVPLFGYIQTSPVSRIPTNGKVPLFGYIQTGEFPLSSITTKGEGWV